MILEFDDDLGQQHIFAHGDELAAVMGLDRDAAGLRVVSRPDRERVHVATLQRPVLVTDHHKIAQLAPTVRDTVFKLFESPVRVTRYGGTSLAFAQGRYPGVWGPNIDTLLFCRALRGEALAGVRSAVEIGCGSGFIGKYLLEHAPHLETCWFVDINPHAVACAREQVQDPRARFHLGDGAAFLRDKRFDLIACNPPYIPRPDVRAGNAYEGIDLLAEFIQHGAEHLSDTGRIVSVYSSVSASVVDPLLAEAGITCRTLDALDVPLKVLNVLNNPAWMDYLLGQRGLQIVDRDGYTYWHTVRVCALHR